MHRSSKNRMVIMSKVSFHYSEAYLYKFEKLWQTTIINPYRTLDANSEMIIIFYNTG